MSPGHTVRVAPLGVAGPVTEGAGDGLRPIAAAAAAGADLILLPQLSFAPYFPARRDRGGLELGERLPSGSMRAALEAAGASHLAASVYECVGEGVFYARGQLGTGADGVLLADRQRRVEAGRGRYEQMFFSPGFGPRAVADLPWGRTGLLVGADVREPSAWAELAAAGAALAVAGVSEPAERWGSTRGIAAGLAAAHGVAVALVNRAPSEAEPGFAGGELIADAAGGEPTAGEGGIYELSIEAEGSEDE
mgnify:CR=1 FL=1